MDCAPGDNLMIHVATERARLGNVLVVDAKGYLEAGPFGDVLATACRATGIVSIVIDGRVRDGAVWAAMGFPAFARGLGRRGTTKAVARAASVPHRLRGRPGGPGRRGRGRR